MRKRAVLQGSSRPIVSISLFVLACSSPPPAPQAEPVTKAAEKPSAEAPERAELPAELSPADLKEVVEPAKVDVRHTCKGVARSRERVEVELTIAGASGAVSHTSVWHDGGNPELAKCVAGELTHVMAGWRGEVFGASRPEERGARLTSVSKV